MAETQKSSESNPYHTEDYILNKKHLIDVWCDLVGVKNYEGGPKLYFSPLELEFIKLKVLSGSSETNLSITHKWWRFWTKFKTLFLV
jgi:hypothetical protein